MHYSRVDLIEEVNDELPKVTKRMNELNTLYLAQLRPSLDPQIVHQNEQAVERCTNEITRVQNKLVELSCKLYGLKYLQQTSQISQSYLNSYL